MNEEYGTDPKDIYSAIGPSVCQKCYEVSEDVILEISESFEKKYWDSLFYIKNGKYQLNLWEANRLIMLEAGIKEEHISMPGICTCCNPGFFFRIVHHMEKEEIWEHFLEYVENNIYKIHYNKSGSSCEGSSRFWFIVY